MFPHPDIWKHNWTSPNGKTHKEIDHILIDRQRNSNLFDIRLYRAADCDTHHCLVVANVRDRLAVNKSKSHSLHIQRFYLKKISEVEGKE
jgi:hypothetical protein